MHQTFAQYYDKLGRNQLQEAGSTLRRAFLLSFSPVARLTLGQPENWLDFRAMMDAGTAFIINLGNISDHETRKLLGAMLLVQIEQAALSRTDLPPAAAYPCTLLDRRVARVCRPGADHRHHPVPDPQVQPAAVSGGAIAGPGRLGRLTGALENCRILIAFGLGRDSAAIQARHIGQADPFLIKEAALPTRSTHNSWASRNNLRAGRSNCRLCPRG